MDDTRIDVTALQRETERVSGRGSCLRVGQLAVAVGRNARKEAGEKRDRRQQKDQQRRDDEQRAPAQLAPCIGPKAEGRLFA